MIYEYDNSIQFLKSVLENKSKKNPQYSMRSFAKKINLSPASLSSIFNEKRKLSLERAMEISELLNLRSKEQEYFLTLVQYEGTKKAALKSQYLEKLKKINPKLNQLDNSKQMEKTFLNVEMFKIISTWHGLAILEYITENPKKSKSTEIAQRLGLKKIEVDLTITKLLKLKLIEKNKNDSYKRTIDQLVIESMDKAEALRSYYRDIHQKSFNSIELQDAHDKVIGAQVFAFDPKDIDEVRELTDQFLNQLNEIAKKGKNKTEIYQALTNIFRLTYKEFQ